MKGLLALAAALTLVSGAPPKRPIPRPQLDGRIVGGQPIDIEEVPYQLSHQAWGSHLCGAVLIGPNHVLTAGHCAELISVFVVSFRAGSNYHASGGQVVAANTVVIHPQYDYVTADFDIAIYSTVGPFTIGATVNIGVLPQPGQNWEHGEPSRVTGWGSLYEGSGVGSDNLQAVNVPIVGLAECRAAYGVGSVTERMLCAGVPQGGLDACQGDSGGPLTVNNVLAGLVSWGYGCARPALPGVYTHLGALRSFITEQTDI